MASAQCAVDGCKRPSDTVCEHCHEPVCTKHFIEHIRTANDELTLLADEVNVLMNVNHQDEFVRAGLEQIEQWRMENYRRIDEVCEQRKQMLMDNAHTRVHKQMDSLREVARKLKDLIDDGDASFKEIESVKKNLAEIRKQYERWSTIDESQPNEENLDLSKDAIGEKLFRGGGTLLSIKHQTKLNEFYGREGQIWTLIYKASRDGFSSGDFHRCCDEQGPTMTVIQSAKEGYLFGGYTSISWSQVGQYEFDRNGPFIFTLTNPHGIPPTKYLGKVFAYSIYGDTNYCSTFGGGHDIYVCSESHKYKQSSIHFPHTYTDTTNQGSLTFTGEKYFQTQDVEVYRLAQP